MVRRLAVGCAWRSMAQPGLAARRDAGKAAVPDLDPSEARSEPATPVQRRRGPRGNDQSTPRLAKTRPFRETRADPGREPDVSGPRDPAGKGARPRRRAGTSTGADRASAAKAAQRSPYWPSDLAGPAPADSASSQARGSRRRSSRRARPASREPTQAQLDRVAATMGATVMAGGAGSPSLRGATPSRAGGRRPRAGSRESASGTAAQSWEAAGGWELAGDADAAGPAARPGPSSPAAASQRGRTPLVPWRPSGSAGSVGSGGGLDGGATAPAGWPLGDPGRPGTRTGSRRGSRRSGKAAQQMPTRKGAPASSRGRKQGTGASGKKSQQRGFGGRSRGGIGMQLAGEKGLYGGLY